jgi:hypothetical protein
VSQAKLLKCSGGYSTGGAGEAGDHCGSARSVDGSGNQNLKIIIVGVKNLHRQKPPKNEMMIFGEPAPDQITGGSVGSPL